MKRRKTRFLSILLALVLLFSCIGVSASAASVATKSTSTFGTLRGELSDPIRQPTYLAFHAKTSITKAPSSSYTLQTTIDILNNATGTRIDHVTVGQDNVTSFSGNIPLSVWYPGYYEDGITFGIAAAHEAKTSNTGYVVYTNRAYTS